MTSQIDPGTSDADSKPAGNAVAATLRPAPELSVVVPAYNESANIGPLVETLRQSLRSVSWELIVVDDDSPDGTAAAVRAIGAQDNRVRCIRRIARRGLAGACLEGILASQGAKVAVMDADLQHDPELLVPMLRALLSGEANLAIGTRVQDAADGDQGMSRMRWRISRLGASMAAAIMRRRVTDPMSGFFMVDREMIESIAPHLSTQGFKLLLDILITGRATLKVVELPYRFRPRQHGESKLDARVAMDYLGLLLAKATGDVLSTRFLYFAVVGLAGLSVHFVALALAINLLSLPFSASQTIATATAIFSNFVLNNILTYGDLRLRGWAFLGGLIRFYAIASVGAVANIGVGSWVFNEDYRWWLAGLAGGCLGVVWNYVAASLFVWRVR